MTLIDQLALDHVRGGGLSPKAVAKLGEAARVAAKDINFNAALMYGASMVPSGLAGYFGMNWLLRRSRGGNQP